MAGAIARGERLKGRYRLERMLGRGGMAAVWLGHDEVLDRPVAVKVMSDTIASDPGWLARFRREARTAAALSHPNLAGVYDFSDDGERPYLVMRFVPGRDLASKIARRERVDRDRLARELLDALAAIHAAGILHRDVKPANVIVEPSGTATLIDFGIALPRDATALTSTGLVIGTERYAAPEVTAGRAASERSDLYSCGLVLRSCEGPGSAALEALVATMTSEDPGDRPVSAAHALRQLERPAAGGEEPTEVFEPVPGGARRGILAAVLGLLAVAAIVALGALSGGDDREAGGGQAAQPREGGGGRSSAAAVAGESSPPEPSGSDPARGAALNEEGFALIGDGQPEAAVPVLEEAVSAFPPGTDDLEYAYALFNLGNALRLSGRPEEAIPILERRLEIPNQEGEVRKELEAAYAEAGARR